MRAAACGAARADVKPGRLCGVQFLAILAIFVPVVICSDYVAFHYRIFPTRVVSDLQPKTHRF